MRTDLWVKMPDGWVNLEHCKQIRKMSFSESYESDNYLYSISVDGCSYSFETAETRDVKFEEISVILKALSVN